MKNLRTLLISILILVFFASAFGANKQESEALKSHQHTDCHYYLHRLAKSILRKVSTGVVNYPQIEELLNPNYTYHKQMGGPAKLIHGTYIEGSTVGGGVQPHYYVDYKHTALREILSFAKKLKERGLSDHEKIDLLRNRLIDLMPKYRPYDLTYLVLLARLRKNKIPANLGVYAENGCGVCRERAIIFHMVLIEAGVDTRFLYVKVKRTRKNKWIFEDHAILLFNEETRVTVLDPYFPSIHGKEFSEFKSGIMINQVEGYQLIEPTPYPRFFTPTK